MGWGAARDLRAGQGVAVADGAVELPGVAAGEAVVFFGGGGCSGAGFGAVLEQVLRCFGGRTVTGEVLFGYDLGLGRLASLPLVVW